MSPSKQIHIKFLLCKKTGADYSVVYHHHPMKFNLLQTTINNTVKTSWNSLDPSEVSFFKMIVNQRSYI